MTEPILLLDTEFEHLRDKIHLVGEGEPAISVNGKSVKISRLITNCPKEMWVDHKDNNAWNNKKDNLRICTPQQNTFNKSKSITPRSSKYKGVTWRTNRSHWVVTITFNGRLIYLGSFTQETAAAKEYNKAALKYFGEFAKLNEIPDD